jgi:hypothetical protein
MSGPLVVDFNTLARSYALLEALADRYRSLASIAGQFGYCYQVHRGIKNGAILQISYGYI